MQLKEKKLLDTLKMVCIDLLDNDVDRKEIVEKIDMVLDDYDNNIGEEVPRAFYYLNLEGIKDKINALTLLQSYFFEVYEGSYNITKFMDGYRIEFWDAITKDCETHFISTIK